MLKTLQHGLTISITSRYCSIDKTIEEKAGTDRPLCLYEVEIFMLYRYLKLSIKER